MTKIILRGLTESCKMIRVYNQMTDVYLKGAVIDSKGDAEKNTLRTGTLSWEDVENKEDYRLSGKGIAVNKTHNVSYNEKGITPAIPTGSNGKADSTTRAGIAPGTIMIQDKDNQRQDMAALNRNTKDSLNKLGEIFDKTKVEERQELAGLFGKLAFNYLHDAKLTPNQRAAWHAAIGGIMGQLSNKNFIAGALPAGINEMMIGEIQKAAHGDPALMQWIGACVGAVAGQLVSGHSQIGGSAAASGVKNNDTLMTPEEIVELMLANGRNADYQHLGVLENYKGQLLGFVNKYQEADAIMVVGSLAIGFHGTPVQASGEIGIIYDLKDNDLFTTYGASLSTDGSNLESTGTGISFVAVRIVCDDSSVNLNDPAIRHSILSGSGKSIQGYYGIGGGVSIPDDPQYTDKIRLVIVGIGTPQIGGDISYSDDLLRNQYEQRKIESEENKYGAD
ncbi:hypothetical protein [uncultured Dialister sp.]|uniref:hypothetical protein n=1 Tax=uncultured Dialister sp. TaxID=278064 RepID=UPI00260CDCDE|nr:hypothetical protein [uncultured Dialister sp.]